MDLTTLVEMLSRINWEWRRAEDERSLTALFGQPVATVLGRTSYQAESVEDLSLYYEGDKTEFVELTLDSFKHPHLLSPVEYEDKVDQFFDKYQSAVKAVTAVLGQPTFDNGAGAPGFPEDQEAVWLALWPRRDSRLMIQQKHEDRELPLRVCIVIAPNA